MDSHELKEWYDGYRFNTSKSIYNPRSVVEAVTSGVCDSYWNQTETFEALQTYIDMNFDGLKDDVLSMIAEEKDLLILFFYHTNVLQINRHLWWS